MKFLRLTGTVRDVFRDETNPEYTFIILACDDGFVNAVRLALQHQPDILIMDMQMPGGGGSAVSDEIARNALQTPATTLTQRQREILTHLARGLTNEQIGRVLGIRADRVKLHVRSILSKIGAANRTEAVALAMKNHMLKI